MSNNVKMPDPETRAKNIAKLRAIVHQLDIVNLMLDEAIALAVRVASAIAESRFTPTTPRSIVAEI